MTIKEKYFEKDWVFALLISWYPWRDKFNLTAVAESSVRQSDRIADVRLLIIHWYYPLLLYFINKETELLKIYDLYNKTFII